MKVKRIEVEGAHGEATLVAIVDGGSRLLRITVYGQAGADVWCLDAADEVNITREARRLQGGVDGYPGTAGDVAEYARLIEMALAW